MGTLGRRVIVVMAVALAMLLVSTSAMAQDAAKARELFESGKKAYNLGDFDKAIDLWKQGYDAKDDAVFLFNIAQAYRQKSDYGKSIFFYKAYLREDPQAKNRADVEARIVELQKLLDAQQTATDAPPKGVNPPGTGTDPTTTTTTTTEPTTTEPTTTEPTTTEPTTTEPTTTTATEPEDPETDRPSPARPGRGMKIAGLVTGGAGVVLVVTGVVFAMKASSIEGEINDAVSAGDPWTQELEDKDASGKSAASIGKITTILGVAAIAGGGVLYYLGMKKDRAAAESAVNVIPQLGPDTAGVLVRLTF